MAYLFLKDPFKIIGSIIEGGGGGLARHLYCVYGY